MTTNTNAGIKSLDDGYAFPTAEADALASAYKVDWESSATLHPKSEFLKASVGATAGSYVGADAAMHLATYEHENAAVKFGFGLSTGAGIRDKSVEVKV